MKTGSGRKTRILVLLAAMCTVIAALSVLMPGWVAAEQPGPLIVYGYVTDDAGRPLEGAHVSLTMKNGGTTVGTLTNDSDAGGFYSVTFGPLVGVGWDVGWTIIATATYGGNQVTNPDVTIPDTSPLLQIDLQFPFEIPQFGTLFGFLVTAGAVGVVAIYLIPKRLRAGKPQ